MSLLPLLLTACQEYNLTGPDTVETLYNPPDLGVEVHTDRITQVTVPSVDVLFVVDNSGSMTEEQRNLRDNFEDFMVYFTDSGLDFHVGVVSTDMDNGQQTGKLIADSDGSRFIDDTYSRGDAVESFKRRANLGTMGSSDERGKDAAMRALTNERERTNVGFYRDDAVLSIVVISDEPDYSRTSTSEFVSWMSTLKPDDEMTWFSSIVGPAPRGCQTAEAGTGYLEVTEQIGGIEYSICEADYSEVLTELGIQSAGLKREFFLSQLPVEDTIAVSVTTEGDEKKFKRDDWVYDGTRNSITFNTYLPDALAVVNVSYEALADARSVGEAEDEGDSGE